MFERPTQGSHISETFEGFLPTGLGNTFSARLKEYPTNMVPTIATLSLQMFSTMSILIS